MYDCMAMKCYVLFILGSAKPHSGITAALVLGAPRAVVVFFIHGQQGLIALISGEFLS
jgi:hypothetical protein